MVMYRLAAQATPKKDGPCAAGPAGGSPTPLPLSPLPALRATSGPTAQDSTALVQPQAHTPGHVAARPPIAQQQLGTGSVPRSGSTPLPGKTEEMPVAERNNGRASSAFGVAAGSATGSVAASEASEGDRDASGPSRPVRAVRLAKAASPHAKVCPPNTV